MCLEKLGGDQPGIDPSSDRDKGECSLTTWGFVAQVDEYDPPIQNFMGRGVTVTPVIMFLVLLGSEMVPLGLPSAVMPSMVYRHH